MKVRGVVFLLLACLAGACANTAAPTASSAGSNPNPASPASTSQASSNPAGGSGNAGASSAGSGASARPSASPSWTPDDVVGMRVNRLEGWRCYQRPGDSCQVPIVGTYFMVASNAGSITIVAFENGSKTPAVQGPPIPVIGGGNQFNVTLYYKIGANARSVSFQAWLKDDRGVILDKSELDTHKLNPPA